MAHDDAHAHLSPTDLGPAFRLAVTLNIGYVIVEGAAGFVTGSLALLADAAHNLTDVAGLLVAWGAAVLAKRAGTQVHTWGLGRATIMAAMFNAIAIIIGVGAVIWEASRRFGAPVDVPGGTILWVALIGIVVNTGSALLFMRSQKDDLNAKGAFLHMAADAAVSVAVVLAAVGIIATGKMWIDPAVAIVVSLLIAMTAAGLLRASLHLSLDGVPKGIDGRVVATFIGDQPGVSNVHDLHIWALSTTRTALAAHVVWDGTDVDAFLEHVSDELEDEFGINHVTLQVETAPCERAGVCLAT
ncbi:MAG: cation transporter [Roseovarius sp.]|nr:cation transporter [Roseovarius sp.]